MRGGCSGLRPGKPGSSTGIPGKGLEVGSCVCGWGLRAGGAGSAWVVAGRGRAEVRSGTGNSVREDLLCWAKLRCSPPCFGLG